MREYNFKCPDCGGDEFLEAQSRNSKFFIENSEAGPILNKNKSYTITYWECDDCGWRFPCRTENDVINFIIKHSKGS